MRKLYRSHDILTTFSFPKKKLIVVKKKCQMNLLQPIFCKLRLHFVLFFIIFMPCTSFFPLQCVLKLCILLKSESASSSFFCILKYRSSVHCTRWEKKY